MNVITELTLVCPENFGLKKQALVLLQASRIIHSSDPRRLLCHARVAPQWFCYECSRYRDGSLRVLRLIEHGS